MSVNETLLVILMLTILLVPTNSSVPVIPEPLVSHDRSDFESYEDMPLKFLCKHNKIVRELIILHGGDNDACIMTGRCVTYISNDPLGRTAVGWCPYIPHNVYWCHDVLTEFYAVSSEHSLAELTNTTCGVYNREDLLCSSCKPGYGPVHTQTYFIQLMLLLCLLAPHVILYGYAVYKIVKRIHQKFCSISRPIDDDQISVHNEESYVGQQPDECTALLNNT